MVAKLMQITYIDTPKFPRMGVQVSKYFSNWPQAQAVNTKHEDRCQLFSNFSHSQIALAQILAHRTLEFVNGRFGILVSPVEIEFFNVRNFYEAASTKTARR